MSIKYPLDKRESVLIEFALRFTDDNLEGTALDDVLTDNEQMPLYACELENMADEFKGNEDD